MSAEVLREAARLMRERAEAVSPDGYGSSWFHPSRLKKCLLAWPNRDPEMYGRFHAARDAEHIASWHPAVALAVADWLDEAANIDHRMPHRQPQIDPDAWVISWCCQECGEAVSDAASVLTECPVDWRSRNPLALAVARAYLGEQP